MANTPLYGAGAPEDRDWDTVEDVTDTIGDQGEGLPTIGSFVLYKLEPLLKEKEDFDNWFSAVSRILEGHGLQRLIDKTILRPTRNSPNAETWMKLSMQVSSWLRICIDPDVAKYITSNGKRTKWADDFMHECKLYMRGEGHGALSAAIVKFIGTKKAEFSTTTEFIEALQQRFKTTNDLKAGIPPYIAIVIMVTQLQEITELRSAIEIKNNELKSIKDPSAELTIQDFFLYCSEMKDKIKEFNIDGGVGANATSNKALKQGQQSPIDRKDKLTNAPPIGKSAWKHVNEWKKHKTQRTATGNCSYCGVHGHDAKDCYHLVADDRPSHWKPKPGLWYWKTKEDFSGFVPGGDHPIARKQIPKVRQILHFTFFTESTDMSGTSLNLPSMKGAPLSRHLHILLINPNSTTYMTENCLNSIQNKIPENVTVTGFTAPPSAPTAIESEADAALSTAECLRALLPILNQFDAFLVACFSHHPLIAALREEVEKQPVIGIMEAALYAARMCGAKLGVISTSERSRLRHQTSIANQYGLGAFSAGCAAARVSVLGLEGQPRDDVNANLVRAANTLVESRDADCICLGCAGMSGMKEVVSDAVDMKGRQVMVIDGVGIGVQFLVGLLLEDLGTAKGVYIKLRNRNRIQYWG
ncbi:unnamed protein product [Penicillium glandicola]